LFLIILATAKHTEREKASWEWKRYRRSKN